jgi:PAS domain S-box-containing protein
VTRLTDDPFAGSGEMRRLCRELDWSATPLGPVETWSPTLRATVRNALGAAFPINLWCGDQLVLIYNDAYRAVLGDKHPHALGRPGAETWAEIWPAIRPMFERIRQTDDAVYSDDAPFVVQRDGEATLGQEVNAWFTFSLSAVRDETGAIVAFLNIVSETTGRILAERRLQTALSAAERAEARLREVFSQAPAFMALLRGADHVFEYANEAYYQLVGGRELIGKPVFEALPEVRGQGFETLLDSVLRTGTPYVGREVAISVTRTAESGPEQRFLDFVYYPIRDEDGESEGVVAHGYDVTDHVLAREEARRARTEAELANQAKSQFLANMSHEIRTPINAVVGYTDLLDANIAGTLTARQHEFVDRIRSSSRHLLGLVNDVLDLAKIEAGEMLVRHVPVDAHPLVTDAVQMVTPEAAARRLEVREEWHCDSPTFLGDEDRVRQVVINLLSNAVKFTPEGGTIVVRCRVIDASAPDAALPETGPWIALEVEDTGIGIPPEQHQSIFNAFVQAESGLTRTAGGTGLGLTISRRLARMMSGDLTLRSAPGNGSCFTLWLPALAQQPIRLQPAAGAAPSDRDPFAVAAELLLAESETVERELIWRLRVELPAASACSDATVADHTAAFVSALARGIANMQDPAATEGMLEDGVSVRMLLAERHGVQRHRCGWTRQDIEAEYRLLDDVMTALIQRDAPKRTSADIDDVVAALRNMLNVAQAASLAAHAAAR